MTRYKSIRLIQAANATVYKVSTLTLYTGLLITGLAKSIDELRTEVTSLTQ